MKCPMKFSNNHTATYECDLSECSWYNIAKEECAVVRISKELSNIDSTLMTVKDSLDGIGGDIANHE